MKIRSPLSRDSRGATLVEFAILAPVFLGMIIAAAQLGLLFFANAGLRNAVSEGARLATLYPRPTNAQIEAKITQRRFGLEPAHVTGPTFVEGTDNGANYTEITMSYAAPVNFLFYRVTGFTLSQTRRVYTQPPPPPPPTTTTP
jgi:Flp pilus assembly protein TadG